MFWNSTITTSSATYRFRSYLGIAYNQFGHRIEDATTGRIILGRPRGPRNWIRFRSTLLLPDGSSLSGRIDSQGAKSKQDWRAELIDQSGQPFVTFTWLPAKRMSDRTTAGRAELAEGLEPTEELVPLVAYGFHWFIVRLAPTGI